MPTQLPHGQVTPPTDNNDAYDYNLQSRTILERATNAVDKIFVVVPVAADDVCNEYIIPEYNRDTTHVIAKSIDWWRQLFQSSGWMVARMSTEFPGCKENWTSRWKDGNAFFILSRE